MDATKIGANQYLRRFASLRLQLGLNQHREPNLGNKMDMHMHHSMGMGDSPSQAPMPASFAKYHWPYFTPEMVERLSERQRGKLSITQEEKQRQQACGFIEAIGSRTGL